MTDDNEGPWPTLNYHVQVPVQLGCGGNAQPHECCCIGQLAMPLNCPSMLLVENRACKRATIQRGRHLTADLAALSFGPSA